MIYCKRTAMEYIHIAYSVLTHSKLSTHENDTRPEQNTSTVPACTHSKILLSYITLVTNIDVSLNIIVCRTERFINYCYKQYIAAVYINYLII